MKITESDGVGSESIKTDEKINYSAADLLKPGENPLLNTKERLYIRALIRHASFSPNPNPELVEVKGLTDETKEILRSMVTSGDGTKKPYTQMVDEHNSKNDSDSISLFVDLVAAEPGHMIKMGIKGDLDKVIERVNNGEANCLEFSLTMQLVAKVYYPDEIKDAQLLAYTDRKGFLHEEVKRHSRHFYLFTEEEGIEGSNYSMAAYGGRMRTLTREQAITKTEEAKSKDQFGATNIYGGFVKLIDSSINNK